MATVEEAPEVQAEAVEAPVVEEAKADADLEANTVTVNLDADPNDPRKLFVNGRVDDGVEFDGNPVVDSKDPRFAQYPEGTVTVHLDADQNDPRRELPQE